jgi:Fe2+ or Zn2+ uptake regulation protein
MPKETQKNQMEAKLNEFEKRCKSKGLKITPQRIAVYKVLIGSVDHPTAEDVYKEVRKELNNISLDTVNRTLHTLTRIGAAFLVEGTGQPKRYDGGLEDHQHFRCMQCGAVIDFHYEPFDNIHVPEQFAEFTILRKSVYFEGICSQCSRNKQVIN